jgi:hypothetical protein
MDDVKRPRTGRPSLPPGEASFNALFDKYKQNARARKHTFHLSKEQFRNLVSEPCYYCGFHPKSYFHKRGTNGGYIYNGIDRLHNSRGYTVRNSVTACQICNYAKGVLTLRQFKDLIKRLYKRFYEGA